MRRRSPCRELGVFIEEMKEEEGKANFDYFGNDCLISDSKSESDHCSNNKKRSNMFG